MKFLTLPPTPRKATLTAAFNPDQERDARGKWTSGGGEPKTGKVDILEIKLGADLSGRDLSGMDLSGADLRDADLRNADLIEVNLHGANLSGANLTGADLTGAGLLGANLSGADLTDINFSGANFMGANLSGANLKSADLSDANLFKAGLFDADLTGANLSGMDFTGDDLTGANLENADLSGASLDSTNLFGANLKNADLEGASLRHADLSGANLLGANLINADLDYADLTGAILPAPTKDNANEDLLKEAIAQADLDPQNTKHFDVEIIRPSGNVTPSGLPTTQIKGSLDFFSAADPVELKEEVERQIADSASFANIGDFFNPIGTARGYTDSWQDSSNNSREAEMIQESASRVLLGREALLSQNWEDLYQGQSTQAELVIFEMYQRTQAKLADAGYKPDDTLTLYRGVRGDDEIVSTALSPLSSWTTDPAIAERFAGNYGTIMGAEVPIANIVATPFTGFGCYDESEVVVLNKPAET